MIYGKISEPPQVIEVPEGRESENEAQRTYLKK